MRYSNLFTVALLWPSLAGAQLAQTGAGGGAGPSLPPNVTLQAIDGESMIGLVQTHNYFSRNGFNEAHTLGFDTSVIPTGPVESDYDDAVIAGTVESMTALGWNSLLTFNSIDNSAVTANKVAVINNAGTSGSTRATNQVGIESFDEPSTYAQGVSTPLGTTPNAAQDNSFWWMNNTASWAVGFGLSSTPGDGEPHSTLSALVATPNSTTRHIDFNTVDIYWFANSRDPNQSFLIGSGGNCSQFYPSAPNGTVDQCARGSNYGDVIDVLRSYQAAGFPAPVGVYTEDSDPFWCTNPPSNNCTSNSTAADIILPPEYNWAIWSQLIHGARWLPIFDHFGPGEGNTDDNLLDPTNTFNRTTQSGQSTSIYNQAITTNAQVQSLATVLLAPFAINYVSVSPAGYSFPTATKSLTGGVEVMAKWYQGVFYIFADLRYGESGFTTKTATFTLADLHATSATVIGESRSVTINAGVFTDTFTQPYTVHIYQVNG